MDDTIVDESVSDALRVLIVADSDSHARLIIEELERTGRHVRYERVDSDDAMRAAIASREWDVVVSDWALAGFSALRALRVVRGLKVRLPLIVVSGTIGDEAAFDLMREGAHDFVLKDNLGRLTASINRELVDREHRAERERMKAALGASEDRYRRIVETTNEGVWIIDGEGNTTFMNERMAAMLGTTVGQIGHRGMAEFIQSNARDVTATRRAHRDGTATSHELTFVRPDGTTLSTLVDSKPIIGNTGAYEGVLNMVTDMTEQQASEQALRSSEDQLRQAQKMEAVGRLAGGVAHDFNNALSVILTYVDFLAENAALGAAPQADVQEIRKAALRAAELTRQLLTFSRQDVIEVKVIDVPEHLNALLKMLPRLVGEDVLLVHVLPADAGHIRADPGQLDQVIMNLAVNARDAMPDGGTLTIACENVELSPDYAATHFGAKAGPHVMIAISDTGIGMNAATQARIFEPFFTTKPIGKGTGLGLSTVFGIAERSGGSVAVVSTPGTGTTFRVYFPRVEAPVDAAPPPSPPTDLRGTETILLVEDEHQVRAAASMILRRSGYHVLEATSAREALAIAEQTDTIDLLVSDVVMPEMSGPELARKCSKLDPSTKIMCMSGYTDDNRLIHEIHKGEIAFLQKPFTADSLRRKVRAVLDVQVGRPSN